MANISIKIKKDNDGKIKRIFEKTDDKMHRCLKKVKEKGTGNPYAICHASLKADEKLSTEHQKDNEPERKDYADPDNYKYLLHKEEDVRDAINYFAQPDNYNRYKPDERKMVAKRIIKAAKRYNIDVSDDFKQKFGIMEKADEELSDVMNQDLYAAMQEFKAGNIQPNIEGLFKYFEKAGYHGNGMEEVLYNFLEHIQHIKK